MYGGGSDAHDDEENASSSGSNTYGRLPADHLDGGNEGDLTLDTALLADDPLDENNGKAP